MMQLPATNLKKKIKYEWILLAFLFISASAIRLHINFGTQYIPGNNGAYYLVQVRSMLEKGRLAFVEFPLIFWLEAGLAWIFFHLGFGNIDSSVDLAVRLFDSIIPALSIIPAFALIKRIFGKQKKIYIPILISGLSVLYFSPLMLVSDFQKNALGVLWLFCLIYWIYRSFEELSKKNLLITILFLLLTGFTHYGCISVAAAFVLLNLILKYEPGFTLKIFLKIISAVITIVVVATGIVYLTSPLRAKVFINIPLEIFRNPIIFFVFQQKPVISPLDLINLLLINLTSVVSLILFIKKFKTLNVKTRSFILSCIIFAFFLASPFLGIDAAQRLYFMSYLPAIPLLIFINNNLLSKDTRYFLMTTVLLVIVLSVILVLGKNTQSNMNEKLYTELIKMKNEIPENGKSIIIARHGMEFWSAWIFRTDVTRQETLTDNYWRTYANVLFLHQKKDKAPFGPAGMMGNPFPEPALPESSRIIYDGNYFDLYKAPSPPVNFSIFKERRP